MKGERLSSDYIANSINVNPVVVRKEISTLQENGLVESSSGRKGGSTLAKSAEEIRISDVYESVNPSSVLGVKRDQPNPKCPVGSQINDRLGELFDETEQAIVKMLEKQTLADFTRNFF
jgi:Rrf2 family protein